MNRLIFIAALLSLALSAGCKSDSQKTGESRAAQSDGSLSEEEQLQNKYSLCLIAQKQYFQAKDNIEAASLNFFKAEEENWNAASEEEKLKTEEKLSQVRAAADQAQEAKKQVIETLNLLFGEGDYDDEGFCKYRILCPPAREKYSKAKKLYDETRGRSKYTLEEKEAAKKAKDKAYEDFSKVFKPAWIEGGTCS